MTLDNEAAQSVGVQAPEPAKPRRQRSQVGHELKRLRREAEYLQIRLQYLKGASSIGDETIETLKTDGRRSTWTEAELDEYSRFLQAKRTNRKLRALVAKQQEVALALKNQRVMAAQNSAMEDLRLTASLIGRLSKLEWDLDNVMNHAGLAHADSLTARSLRRVDPDMALVIEKAFCWPVRCSVEQADSYLMPQFRQRVTAIKAANDSARFTKIMYFEHDQQLHELRIKTHMHKVVQPDRVIYMQSSLFSLHGEGLSFIEDCIFLVRRPAFESSSCGFVATPAPGSLLLGWNRIRALQQGAAPSIDSSDQACLSLKEHVMNMANGRIESNLLDIKTRIQETNADAQNSRSPIEASCQAACR